MLNAAAMILTLITFSYDTIKVRGLFHQRPNFEIIDMCIKSQRTEVISTLINH